MKKLTLACIAIIGIVSIAGANTFTADGGLLDPTHGYNTIADRALVNDGDFEGGTCLEAPIWMCTTDNGCDWITDLVPLGLWNYSGVHIAWLGGFCGGLATVYTYICQDLNIDGCFMSWWWMGYINSGGELITVTIDGVVVYTYITDLADHLLDYQLTTINIGEFFGAVHTVCFNYDLQVAGDNYFMDWVEIFGATATENTNFSTVKALY